jgi:hypothetical protein
MGRELVKRSENRGYSHLDQIPEEVLLQELLPELRHQLRLIDLGDLVGAALLVQTATEGEARRYANDCCHKKKEKKKKRKNKQTFQPFAAAPEFLHRGALRSSREEETVHIFELMVDFNEMLCYG